MKTDDPLDRKGLMVEAYRIEGIDAGECRSIFLDWALSLPDGADMATSINAMLEQYQGHNPDHPMTVVLNDGMKKAEKPRRRGGWRSRERD
ncbi:hypothetical protein ROA7450_00448 [Roseovarius albus]|uniref:Uncharacterized protein n=1 Tax=Roseovarius albus TaxID=1247867 RepID=A0A1X6YDV9_9RHOB|nr:hypothetical protein [Roseovarius albus]SLN16634.1 hypothetical protein ROA7450_00448 [Roseovarius albus]